VLYFAHYRPAVDIIITTVVSIKLCRRNGFVLVHAALSTKPTGQLLDLNNKCDVICKSMQACDGYMVSVVTGGSLKCDGNALQISVFI